jgi:FKBP-type peptidyl-prolyl cis-trans isomerase
MFKRKKSVLALAVAAMGAAVVLVLVLRWLSKLPKSHELPDYSGITIDHVIKQRIKAGTGTPIVAGDKVNIHGRPLSGDSPQETDITIGQHQVVEGWEQALVGMQEGEEAILVIPPNLAYGPAGSPDQVPGGAMIQVATTILSIEKSRPK